MALVQSRQSSEKKKNTLNFMEDFVKFFKKRVLKQKDVPDSNHDVDPENKSLKIDVNIQAESSEKIGDQNEGVQSDETIEDNSKSSETEDKDETEKEKKRREILEKISYFKDVGHTKQVKLSLKSKKDDVGDISDSLTSLKISKDQDKSDSGHLKQSKHAEDEQESEYIARGPERRRQNHHYDQPYPIPVNNYHMVGGVVQSIDTMKDYLRKEADSSINKILEDFKNSESKSVPSNDEQLGQYLEEWHFDENSPQSLSPRSERSYCASPPLNTNEAYLWKTVEVIPQITSVNSSYIFQRETINENNLDDIIDLISKECMGDTGDPRLTTFIQSSSDNEVDHLPFDAKSWPMNNASSDHMQNFAIQNEPVAVAESQPSNQSDTPILPNVGRRPTRLAPNDFECCHVNVRLLTDEYFRRIQMKDPKTPEIINNVHRLPLEQLEKIFDGLLYKWSEFHEQNQRFNLYLYGICERFLKQRKHKKFLDTFGNGMTIIDSALYHCGKIDYLIPTYLADCKIRALLNESNESFIELIDTPSSDGKRLLHRVPTYIHGLTKSIVSLLSLNDLYQMTIFDVNQFDNNGETPLHVACNVHYMSGSLRCSCIVMVHLLLKHGRANPNIPDQRSGNTPLHNALVNRNCAPKLIRLLVAFKADPLKTNRIKKTPLAMLSAEEKRAYPEDVIKMLKGKSN